MNYLTVRRPANATGTTGLGDFDRLFRSVFDTMPSWTDQKPAVDIRSTDNEYIVDADLPGFTEKQIDVRVENDLLVISARNEEEKKDARKNEEDSFMVRERHMRSFYRSFALPKDADTGSVDATYRNGVLTLTIPKKEEAKARQIQIKRG
jgi:HSP20 family protein